jgi:hypothetical protein
MKTIQQQNLTCKACEVSLSNVYTRRDKLSSLEITKSKAGTACLHKAEHAIDELETA